MQAKMNQSRRQLPPVEPHKRKQGDETFDFLKLSTRDGQKNQSDGSDLVDQTKTRADFFLTAPRSVRSGPCPSLPSTTTRPPLKLAKPKPVSAGPRAKAPIKPSQADSSSPTDNILLAGYLAHEFLNRDTLFGQLYDPAQAKAKPASSAAGSVDHRTMKQPSPGFVSRDKGKAVEVEPSPQRRHVKARPKASENKIKVQPQVSKILRYAQVSELLKNGVHIPGIVNPSQLARFLEI